MCVCVLGVSSRIRDAKVRLTVDRLIRAVVGGSRGELIPFWGTTIAGSTWHLRAYVLQRMSLRLGSGQSKVGPEVLSVPPSPSGMNADTVEGGISTDVDGCIELHDHEIGANPLTRVPATLSSESHQSVRGTTNTTRTQAYQGFRDIGQRPPATSRTSPRPHAWSAPEQGWHVCRHSAERVRLQDESPQALS